MYPPFLGMVFLRLAALGFAILDALAAFAFLAAALPLAVYGNFFPLTLGITSPFWNDNYIHSFSFSWMQTGLL